MEANAMRIDDLSGKRISLGKCIINATEIPGIYRINDIATVAAIGPAAILTGDYGPNGKEDLTILDKNLLNKEVALVKEYVFGTVTAYNIVDLSTVTLPNHMIGKGNNGSIWPNFD